jgi:ABC-type Zn uptake system ZnuABC Zn-binding protein ZnuA
MIVRRRGRRGVVVPSVLLVVLALAVGACGGGPAGSPPADDARLNVVATTTVFADLVAQVGGDRVEVTSLVPKGGEVHTFDPTPSDIRHVVEADLIVRNGLGLDDWLAGLVHDAGTQAPVVVLGEDLPGVEYLGGDPDHGEGVNPHLWLDVANARAYASRIASALTAADPAGAAAYAERAKRFDAELAALDTDIRDSLGAVPEEARTVISFHDAFPYFARAYGLTIDGTIVEAPGQDPSASQVEALVQGIREHGVRAILAEVQFSDKLAQAIAAETDAVVVSDLYTDTLGEAPLDSYVAIMRWNTDRLVEALSGS